MICLFRVLLSSVLVALSACAVRSTEYSRSGFYAGASAVGSVSNFGEDEIDDNEYSLGLGIRGGYRFLDRFAVEVAWETAEDYEFSDSVDVEIQTLAAQGKFFPLTGAVQPYALFGIGRFDADVSEVDIDEEELFYRLGLGLEMYLLESLPIFVEADYNVPTEDLDELEYASLHIGALFRF